MYAKEKREGDYKVGKEIGLDYTVAGNFSWQSSVLSRNPVSKRIRSLQARLAGRKAMAHVEMDQAPELCRIEYQGRVCNYQRVGS